MLRRERQWAVAAAAGNTCSKDEARLQRKGRACMPAGKADEAVEAGCSLTEPLLAEVMPGGVAVGPAGMRRRSSQYRPAGMRGMRQMWTSQRPVNMQRLRAMLLCWKCAAHASLRHPKQPSLRRYVTSVYNTRVLHSNMQ